MDEKAFLEKIYKLQILMFHKMQVIEEHILKDKFDEVYADADLNYNNTLEDIEKQMKELNSELNIFERKL